MGASEKEKWSISGGGFGDVSDGVFASSLSRIAGGYAAACSPGRYTEEGLRFGAI